MNRYNMACTEILEILKYLPNEEYEEIPKDEIDFFKKNRDKDYSFKFNENVSFEEQAILPETQGFIVKLYRDYFCTDEQKLSLNKIIYINNEISRSNKNNGDFMTNFPNQLKKNNTTTISSNFQCALQIPKKRWYENFLNIFCRKKN